MVNMETSQDILVIILSTTLAVLLVLCITIAIMTIRLLQAIQRIADKAEHVVQTAEQVGQAFSKATESMAVVRLARNFMSMVGNASEKREK